MNRQIKPWTGVRPVHQLDEGYTAEFDSWSKASWDELVGRFRDANLYQAWSYDAVRRGHDKVAHFVLQKQSEVVAVAQVRIATMPGTAAGIAYVRWGPLWRPDGLTENLDIFRHAVRALRDEFSRRRGLVLRLYPLAYRGEDDELEQVLFEEGYKPHGSRNVERTLIVDLRPSVDELRAALEQKWRNCLNRAEKNGLELLFGEDEGFFDRVTQVYWEMVRRKSLVETSDIEHLRRVQKDLPSRHKLKVVLCLQNSKPAAGAVFSAVGTTGVYLIGATSDAGLKTKGSYLVQWEFIKWLKENGFTFYDLNGINRSANPGTYRFKSGLAGKNGREVEFLGKFQVSDSGVSSCLVGTGELLVSVRRRLSNAISAMRRKATSS